MKNAMTNILPPDDISKFFDILCKYNSEAVNKISNTEHELLDKCDKYTNDILSYAKSISNDNIFFLNNEIRAMFGHLADYRVNSCSKSNLNGANTHYRRLNIDIFKVLCDEIDKFCLVILKSHYHYDFRGIRKDFLEEYAAKYIDAKQKYEYAKQRENVGSNRKSNIIALYHEATKAYVKTLICYQEFSNKLKSARFWQNFKYIFNALSLTLGVIVSIIDICFLK